MRGNQALLGSFAIDLVAMTFGMPRALFAVLAVSVYHAGATGTGVLYSAVSLGATIAAITTGWLSARAQAGAGRDLGRDRVGVAITFAGSCLLAVARGRACSRSPGPRIPSARYAGRRSTRPSPLTTCAAACLRSFSLVVSSGPRLGDIESGVVAGATSARFSVTSGGLACLVGVGGIVMIAFPALKRYDSDEWIGEPAPSPA